MNHLFVNGVEKTAPLASDQSFSELMSYVQQHYSSPSSVVSSIRVNGVELDEKEQRSIQDFEIAEFESVEVTFSHPREIAEETLQTLREFLPGLIALCKGPKTSERLRKLFDGIQILADAVSTSKSILSVDETGPHVALEAELSGILERILQASQAGQLEEQNHLISETLATNLEIWNTQALPQLIRSRDC